MNEIGLALMADDARDITYEEERNPPQPFSWLRAFQCVPVADCPRCLVIWEPLPRGIPGPGEAKPYCCYIQTVIFYAIDGDGRYIVENRDGGAHPIARGFREHARLDTRTRWGDRLEHGGMIFELAGGRVVWRAGRWWMRRWARRVDR